MPTPAAATPVRALGMPDPAGYRLLREVGNPYRDGAEDDVLRIIAAASDRASTSVEMLAAASGWAQRYHVDPTRANILRCIDLPAGARVLEIGAGCGAITRYLGEQGAVVDALEPVAVRAASASLRTVDLADVQVFVGELADVPAEPVYDVVVVIGVLEYVGAGGADPAPYAEFLAGVRDRLAEGGTLVLAIENQLGVKYLVGSPEDHTNRVFDSVEGYPRGGRARTFSRRELERMLQTAGLAPATRVAFPDYKMTRAVLGELPEAARSLLYRTPNFPSPDWRAARPRLADERAVWQTLVEAGLELEFGNSFLVLAGKGRPSPLWPAGQGGVFFSTDRRTELMTRTVIEAAGNSVVLRRSRLVEDAPAGKVRIVASDALYEPGTDLAVHLAAEGAAAFAGFAQPWLELVDAALAADPETAIDVVPHNLVLDDGGKLRVIDVELADTGVTRERIIRRGIFWLADRVAPLAPPQRWAPSKTIGDLMRELGGYAGLPPDGSWLAAAVADEVELLARVRPGPPAGLSAAEWRAQLTERTTRRIDRTLADLPFGDRLPDQLRQAQADLKTARRELATARKQLDAARSGAARSSALGRMLPRGTRRRALAERIAGRARKA